jgi:rare lipoprotein A
MTQQQNKQRKPLRVLVLLAAASMTLALAPASAARDLAPEFSTRAWVENDTECAAVAVNGKDITTFRARAGSGAAAAEADDLAAELADIASDRGFDPSLLLPAREGDKAVIRLGGTTACSFVPLIGKGKADAATTFETSLKLVNGLRVALGERALPNNLPDISDRNALAAAGKAFSGQASWYGPQFHGRRTSDGSRFDMEKMTAAHRSLPFGTKLLVMNRQTGDSCVVHVNDRGPFIGNRVLDLSRGAARKLNMLGSGVAMVDCLIIGAVGTQN